MDSFSIQTQRRNEFVDITAHVKESQRRRGIRDGIGIVYCPHTTAGITINENADPDVQHDLLEKFSRLVPKHEDFYDHGEGNSDSHVKTACVGSSVTVLIENGRLMLGRWQGIYLCEFDGPREREVWVKVVGFE